MDPSNVTCKIIGKNDSVIKNWSFNNSKAECDNNTRIGKSTVNNSHKNLEDTTEKEKKEQASNEEKQASKGTGGSVKRKVDLNSHKMDNISNDYEEIDDNHLEEFDMETMKLKRLTA